jgi:hypothetical protein
LPPICSSKGKKVKLKFCSQRCEKIWLEIFSLDSHQLVCKDSKISSEKTVETWSLCYAPCLHRNLAEVDILLLMINSIIYSLILGQ